MTEVPKKPRKTGAKKNVEVSTVTVIENNAVESTVTPEPVVEPEPLKVEEQVDIRECPPETPICRDTSFTASQGRLRKLFNKAGLTGRIAKDVFEILDEKIKCLVLQKVKNLKIKDKKIVYEPVEAVESYELPITPFRDYLKSIIRKEHDVTRVSPDVVEALHGSVEKDIIKLCQYAQDIMKNSSRKTLFANDIEVAGKALL